MRTARIQRVIALIALGIAVYLFLPMLMDIRAASRLFRDARWEWLAAISFITAALPSAGASGLGWLRLKLVDPQTMKLRLADFKKGLEELRAVPTWKFLATIAGRILLDVAALGACFALLGHPIRPDHPADRLRADLPPARLLDGASHRLRELAGAGPSGEPRPEEGRASVSRRR
jgi:hypothetical protein